MKAFFAGCMGIMLALSAGSALAAKTAAATGSAAPGLGIVATVGGEAITSYDLDGRLRFIITTANLSNTPDVIQHIKPQVLRSLIDEKLQLQEAEKNDIKVTDDEVAQAIASIEQERHMQQGDIDRMLDDNHIPKSTFTQQIKAQLAWHKLLLKKIKPRVHITDDDVKLAMQRIAAGPAPVKKTNDAPHELKIAVIALPVDKPSRESEMKRLGEKLVKEIRSGASFEEVSRQFSSAAASAGGKVDSFWVRPEQLDPLVARALTGIQAGGITDPVRTPEGYTIVKVYETRVLGNVPAPEEEAAPDVQVSLKEILLKLKSDAKEKEAKVLLQIAEDLAKHPGTCAEKGIAGVENTDDFDIQVNYRDTLLSDLPPALRIIAGNLKVGDISTPFASDDGILLYMLCDKKDASTSPPPDYDHVRNMLLMQKLDLDAQGYIRTLRRETYIDIR